jgi:hypothetical protein
MPEKADGIQFQDPHQTLLVKRIMDRFVDDTIIWQNYPTWPRLFIPRGHPGNRCSTPDCCTMVITTTARHGRAPTSGLGLRTTSHRHNCSARWRLHQQLHRLVPMPLGSTLTRRFLAVSTSNALPSMPFSSGSFLKNPLYFSAPFRPIPFSTRHVL